MEGRKEKTSGGGEEEGKRERKGEKREGRGGKGEGNMVTTSHRGSC